MVKKALSMLLSLLLLISYIPTSATAAEIDFSLKGDGTVTVTGEPGDEFYVIFSIDPVSNVLGLGIELEQNTNYFSFGLDNCEFNEDIDFFSSLYNPTPNGSSTSVALGMLFNEKGQSFTKKTDLVKVRLSVKTRKYPTNIPLNFTVNEFYDSSNDMKDIDPKYISARVEKIEKEVTLNSITVKAPSKTSYFVGESLDTTGMTVTAKYSDNTTKDVTKEATLSGFDSKTAGTKKITVSYQDKTATFNVTVKDITLSSISVTEKPNKLEYFVGEDFNPTGIKVTATYNNGTTADVTNSVTYSGFSSTSAGTKTIKVTYQEKTTTFTVSVKAVTITEIKVTNMPNKTEYYIGQNFDSMGIKVTAYYNNGTTADVTNNVTYSGFSSTSAGTKTVKVTYQSKSATFEVTVLPLEVTSISITTNPTKLEYYVGDTFDSKGIKVTATYNNGSTADVTSKVTYSGFDSTSTGMKTVTVTYEGKSTAFNVTVYAVEVTEIVIKSKPTKLSYYVGDTFDSTGIKVTATYNNGSTADVTSDVTYSGFDSTTAGTKTVTVTYQGKTATFEVTVKAIEATRISITSKPDKLSYYVGESFDPTGMKVTATYNNGTIADVTDDVTLSGFDSTTAGTKTITVTYQGKTATFTVTVKAVSITGISITENPSKLEYYVGESFDPTGIKITATYSDGTTADVTNSVIYSGFNSTTAGTKTITVTYQGKTATFTVTVKAVSITGISITENPSKLEYYVGESFDPTGIKITATYSDGSTADVTNSVTYSGFNSTTAGTKTITVTYQGKTATFDITVREVEVEVVLESIAITAQPIKLEYYVGESFNPTGIKVTATYSDGSTADVTSDVTFSGFNSTTAGTKTITVTYQGKTATFDITVREVEVEVILESIAITANPIKLEYYVGENFDSTGIKVTAIYSDGTTADVTNGVTFSGFDSTTSGKKTITVTYQGKTATFDITVREIEVEVILESIAITSQPIKLEYYVGENFDSTGIKVTAIYSDGTTADVTNDVTFSGFNSTTTGTKTITVTYQGKTTTFNVTVREIEVEVVLESIAITSQPIKLEYYVGENFAPTGIKVTATYSDGTTADVTSNITYSGFDSTTAGTKTITVTYQGKTATFTVTVREIEVEVILESIAITSQPIKLEYYVGENFDPTGVKVTATYSDGSTADVTSDITFSGFDSTTAGTKTITVTYQGKIATFTVTVREIEVEVVLESIAITANPIKLEYYVGENFDPTGIKVTATYSDGTTADVTSNITYSGFDSTTAGTKTITVTYQGKTAAFDITVREIEVEVVLESIAITANPIKLEYYVGENFDPTGIKVTATYSDGTTADVTSNVTFSGFDSITAGKKTITVTYQGKTATFDITVREVEVEVILESIAITSQPIKLEYYVGENFDPTGIKVTATYSDGTTADVTSNVTFSGFDSTTAGTKTIMVTYQGKTATFDIVVSELPEEVTITKIEVTNMPVKTTYYIGEELDLSDLIVTAVYSDGTVADVTNYVTVTGFDSSTPGEKVITVSYNGVSTEFIINVIEETETMQIGDIDNDGEITANDAVIILRYSIGLDTEIYCDYEEIMDVDHDGVISANDAVLILQYSINLIDSFD